MKKHLIILLIALIFSTLSGCAPTGMPIIPSDDADSRWQAFVSRSSGPGSYDFLSGSLRFGPKDDTRRVTYTMWSSLPEAGRQDTAPQKIAERTIRIDVRAGLGISAGSMLFSDGGMTLLVPSERRIFIGSSAESSLRTLLGLSLPFGIQNLNDFLAGRFFGALDAPKPERYEKLKNGSFVYRYRVSGGYAEIELDPQALPIRCKGPAGWELLVTFDEKGLPAKLSGTSVKNDEEQKFVLLVKERGPSPSESSSAMRLDIPAGFKVYSLD